jgi:hypothetical protein
VFAFLLRVGRHLRANLRIQIRDPGCSAVFEVSDRAFDQIAAHANSGKNGSSCLATFNFKSFGSGAPFPIRDRNSCIFGVPDSLATSLNFKTAIIPDNIFNWERSLTADHTRSTASKLRVNTVVAAPAGPGRPQLPRQCGLKAADLCRWCCSALSKPARKHPLAPCLALLVRTLICALGLSVASHRSCKHSGGLERSN